jgi:3-hydroxyacyl-CoA dehydrogenase
MAGLDVYRHVFGILERGLGERFQVPATLAERVDQGYYGTKTGAGFFSYTPEERERLFADRDRRYAALSELLERLP